MATRLHKYFLQNQVVTDPTIAPLLPTDPSAYLIQLEQPKPKLGTN